MKQPRKNRLLVGLAFILMLVVCLSIPLAASAADGGEEYPPAFPESVPEEPSPWVYVWSDSLSVTYGDGKTYMCCIYADAAGAPFAGWQMTLELPEFITVTGVYSVMNSESTPFVWNLLEGGRLLAMNYTSDVNTTGAELCAIEFYLNDYAEAGRSARFSAVDFEFVNVDSEQLSIDFSGLGAISVAYESDDPLKGDFDLDGQVTLADVILIQRYIAGMESIDDRSWYAADVNRDGRVTVADCQYIRAYLIGKLDSLENIYDEPSEMYDMYVVLRTEDGGLMWEGVPVRCDSKEVYGEVTDFIMYSLEKRFDKLNVIDLYTASGVEPYDYETCISGPETFYVVVKAYDEEDVWTEIEYNGDFKFYLDSDRDAVVDVLAGREVYIYRYAKILGMVSNVGSTTVTLTDDNLGDLTDIDFSRLDAYVEVPVVIDGVEYKVYGYVVPDFRGAECIMAGVRLEGERAYYFEIYDNGFMKTCRFEEKDRDPWYNYMEYEMVVENDEPIIMTSGNGYVACYVLNENETYQGYPTVTDLMPADDEELVPYYLSGGEGYLIRLETFGGGRYAMMYKSSPDEDEEYLATVSVYVDEEENTFFFMNTVYAIDEDHYLILALPDEEPVEVVSFGDEESQILLYADGVGYYVMNENPLATATWVGAYDGDGVLVKVDIDMMDYKFTYYKWQINGSWNYRPEPDFASASQEVAMVGDEEATLYVWDGTSEFYALFANGELKSGYFDNYWGFARIYNSHGQDESYLVGEGVLIPVEEYRIYTGNETYRVYVADDGVAVGEFGYLTDYRPANVTCVIGEDDVWTFIDKNGKTLLTCTPSEDEERTLLAAGYQQEEKVIVYLKDFVDGKYNEESGENGISFVRGASLWDAFGYMIGMTVDGDNGELLCCSGIYLDAAGRKPLSEKDIATDNLALYVFWETVKE